MKKQYKRILVALDGSDRSLDALRESIETTKRNEGKLYILAVKDENPYYGLEFYPQKILQAASEMIETNIDVEFHDGEGVPKKVIIDFAKDNKIDLIFVGATGIGFIEKLKLGSTTQYVINNSPCNVMVVR